jgi:hypothetical protein
LKESQPYVTVYDAHTMRKPQFEKDEVQVETKEDSRKLKILAPFFIITAT